MKSLLARVRFLGSVAVLLAVMGCSRDTPTPEGAFANDLKGAPVAPIAKGGIPDDSIKPVVKPVVIGKTGIPDDSIKPVAKGGVPDDSVKPRTLAPAAAPAPAPR